MDGQDWPRVRACFLEALEHPPGAWAAFLDAACPEAALRAEVEALLKAHDDRFALALEPRLLTGEDADALPGTRIGPYRLLRRIGEGGMGAVYLAERADEQYRQQVALKIVRPGYPSGDLIRRFRMERQILARLSHPHIARLLDGGMTEDGRPYLVMQYIEGQAITTYCDAHRLTIEERLRLFRTVCDAVQFAHRSLVVHRDLKPSNILVTEDGTVKLLDFGIAKLLDAEAMAVSVAETRPDLRVMTPAYAAPEQVRGETVTTATDVYALGILLYELLTGRRPYHVSERSRADIERVICEDTPTRPSVALTTVGTVSEDENAAPVTPERVAAARRIPLSRLRRHLRGELDNIVMMALRKEPARRYGSAEQLGEDIARHLDGRPVLAQKDTVGYRMGKFVRRHRIGVAMTAVLVVLLLGFVVFTAQQAGKLARERDKAQLERDKAEQVVQIMADLFQGSDPNQAQDGSITAREILDQGAEKVRRELEDQPEVKAQMLGVIGQVYRNLGLYDQARPALEEALALYRQRADHTLAYATVLKELANLYYRLENMDAAAPLLREALDLTIALQGDDDPEVASILNSLALVLEGQNRLEEARATLQRVVALRRHLLQGTPDENLAANLNNLASMLQDHGDLTAADSLYREALAMLTALYGDSHPYLAFTSNSIASLHQEQGDFARAEQDFRRALEIGGAFFPEDHPFMTVVHHNLGKLFQEKKDYPAARAAYERALALRRRTLPPDHPDLGDTLLSLGIVLTAMEQDLDAEPYLHEALQIRQAAYTGEDWRTAQAQAHLGRCLMRLKRYTEAEALLRESYRISREQRGDDDAQTRQVRAALFDLYTAMGRVEEADAFRRATS